MRAEDYGIVALLLGGALWTRIRVAWSRKRGRAAWVEAAAGTQSGGRR